MKKLSKNYFFVCATEQSGDNLGEKIISKLKLEYNNKLLFDGVGGSKMSPLLNNQFYSLENFKSIGLFEIFFSIKKYLSIIEELSQIIIKNNYRIVITIDSPDFNIRLAKKIKKKGFSGKIIQIVAPTVWAWRKGRSREFAKFFDKIFTILPFEKKYFQKYNLSTSYIGHPIYWIMNYSKNIIINNKYILFMPGSREREVLSLIKYFKVASDYLDEISSKLIIFIPVPPHLKNKLINLTKDWNRKPIIKIINDNNEELFSQTSIAVVCSGTASLEIAKRKIPQLVIYKLNYFTEIILKFIISVKFANIINIMADKMIIPEIINSKLNEKSFLKGFKQLIHNKKCMNEKQIIDSRKYINQLILNKSPAEIAVKEIKKLLF